MKLNRFQRFDESFSFDDMSKEEQYRYISGFMDIRGINSKQDAKNDLINELIVVWDEYLEKKYNKDKYSLNSFTSEELEGIKKDYNSYKNNSKEPNKTPENKNVLIEQIKNELEQKYLSNEAVNSISIGSDEIGEFIQFNVKCDTEIHSGSEYNGCRLKYIKVCEFKNENIENIDLDNEQILEKYRFKQSINMSESLLMLNKKI